MSTLEIALASSYDSLGRRDLGDFVRGGKKYQRLNDMLSGHSQSIDSLNALRQAITGVVDEVPPKSKESWMKRAGKRYRRDAGVVLLNAQIAETMST